MLKRRLNDSKLKENKQNKLTSSNKSHSFSILASINAISLEFSSSCGTAATLFFSTLRVPLAKCFLSNFSRGVCCMKKQTEKLVYQAFKPDSLYRYIVYGQDIKATLNKIQLIKVS